MDASTREAKIKSLKTEQEEIQLEIINTTHAIEDAKQAIKFAEKRLKASEQELKYYEGLANGDQAD